MFRQGDIDVRFLNERMQWTETVCDCCGGVILESEHRYICGGVTRLENDTDHWDEQIHCSDCAQLHPH